MSKKPSTVIKKIKDTDEIRQVTLEWFERMNKPVTPQFLTDALGSRVSKPQLQKMLDELVAQSVLLFKDLKKVRFYFLNLSSQVEEGGAEESGKEQAAVESVPAITTTEEDLTETDGEEKMVVVTEILNLMESIRVVEGSLDMLKKRRLLSERQENVDRLSLEINEIEEDIAALVRNAGESNKNETDLSIEEVIQIHHRLRSLWKERKEITLRLIDSTFGETYSSEDLSDLFGITFDEEAGVSLFSSSVPLPPSL